MHHCSVEMVSGTNGFEEEGMVVPAERDGDATPLNLLVRRERKR